MYGSRQGVAYAAMAVDHAHMFQAQDEIRMLLRAWRKLPPGQDDNFAVVSSDSFAMVWERMTSAIAATAVAVVSVFMVVGGIVIMNIMMAGMNSEPRRSGSANHSAPGARKIRNSFWWSRLCSPQPAAWPAYFSPMDWL